MELMKRLMIIVGGTGMFLLVIGAGGADCGANDKAWMSAAIIGVLMIILSRLMYCHLNWIQEERERKSIRNRRHQEGVSNGSKDDDKETVSKLQESHKKPC